MNFWRKFCAYLLFVFTFAFLLPVHSTAAKDELLNIGKFAKKAGVQKQFTTAAKGLGEASELLDAFNKGRGAHTLSSVSQLSNGLQKLKKFSSAMVYVGAVVDLALIFLPQEPDPVLKAVGELSDQVSSLQDEMNERFKALDAKNTTNFLDLLSYNAIKDINTNFEIYNTFQSQVKEAKGTMNDPDLFRGQINELSGKEILGSVNSLADLCTGTPFFGGKGVFQAHIDSSNGDVMDLIGVAQYIVSKMIQAQIVHGARILYGAGSSANPNKAKAALDINGKRHAEKLQVCIDAFDDALERLNDRAQLKRIAKKGVQAEFSSNKTVKAGTMGKFLEQKYPHKEWVVISYPKQEKAHEQFVYTRIYGDSYFKLKNNKDHTYVVGFYDPGDYGRVFTDDCAENLRLFNIRNRYKNKGKTVLMIDMPKEFVRKNCGESPKNPMLWVSFTKDVTLWRSNKKSVKSQLKKGGVDWVAIADGFNFCTSKKPDWGDLAAVGGYSREAWFFDENGKYFTYDKRRECFDEEKRSISRFHGLGKYKGKIVASLDFSQFESGKHYFLLDDGRYVVRTVKKGVRKLSKPFSTAGNWKGITAKNAKNIAAVSAIPSKNKVYFFFHNGLYSRYDLKTKKVDFANQSIAKNWKGVGDLAKRIVAVADFEEKNGHLYFFYSTEWYAKYSLKESKVVFNGHSETHWK